MDEEKEAHVGMARRRGTWQLHTAPLLPKSDVAGVKRDLGLAKRIIAASEG